MSSAVMRLDLSRFRRDEKFTKNGQCVYKTYLVKRTKRQHTEDLINSLPLEPAMNEVQAKPVSTATVKGNFYADTDDGRCIAQLYTMLPLDKQLALMQVAMCFAGLKPGEPVTFEQARADVLRTAH